ncbi:MAG: hypothetical protein HFJ09_00970 [Lachnospiraceae bacterium]|nr:hypothetical protein [Lachnospiraceae bacterium]
MQLFSQDYSYLIGQLIMIADRYTVKRLLAMIAAVCKIGCEELRFRFYKQTSFDKLDMYF